MGSRFWPGYTVRTLALFAWVLAVLFALGGLAQINPVWLYGPFCSGQATSPRPTRLVRGLGRWRAASVAPVEFQRSSAISCPPPFFPGVVVGGFTFLLPVSVCPCSTGGAAVVAWRTSYLTRPANIRSASAWAWPVLVFFTVLLVAAADGIIAKLLRVPMLDVLLRAARARSSRCRCRQGSSPCSSPGRCASAAVRDSAG